MLIAILSDIHDNIWRLEKALPQIEQARAEALLFLGDFCVPFTLKQIADGFKGPIHVVFGNNDGDKLLLHKTAIEAGHVMLHGDFAELELGSKRIAMTHYPKIGAALAASGKYDLVCYGHDHRCHVSQAGSTLLINPGETMGRFGPSTWVLYDTETGKAIRREVG
jgi:putative phosphoesterase